MNEDLRKWFGKGKEGDWVRVGTDGKIKGDCAREPGEGKPKCMPRSKAHSMGKDDRATAARRKRREDPVADRKGKGNKPVMVNTEEFMMEGNEPTNPSLWSKAKSLAKQKFDVYPSAYANGWAAKYYKSKGGGWKSVSEEAVDEACWKGYKRVGMKKKGDRMVPNCVPEATDIIAKAKAAVAKKAGAKLKLDPDTGTPDHFTAAQRRKKGLPEEADSKKYPRKGFPEPGDYGYHPNPGLKPQESDKDEDMDVAYKKATEKEGRKPLNAKITEASYSHREEEVEQINEEPTDPNYHAKVHQDLQWHASRNKGRHMGAANYNYLASLHNQSHIEKHYEKTVLPILKKHGYPAPPEGPGDSGNQKYHDAVRETIKKWKNERRVSDVNESTKVDEELGKSNEWGTPELRKKYAAMTPGQESLSADKIPSFDPRYDDVTTQHLGLHPFREGYLAEISAKASIARDDFKKKLQRALVDPKNIARAKKVLAKRKEAEKAKEAPHLVMQLRKVVSIGSKVQFQDGQHHAISGNHADIFMSKYNSAKSSIEKEALQKRAHKSHAEFMKTIAEDHSPDCEPMDNMGTHHVDSYEAHRGSGDQISPVISHDDEDIRFQDFDEEAFEKELEADVLALSWDDLVDLYDEDEIEYVESPEEEGEDLEEGITPAGRLKKKFNAMRSKSRRMMARNIAIKRVSSPEKLKSRSIRAARRMVYKRLLRNRDISTVSSSEKTRLEAQIKRMAPMVARLSVRVMPAVRKLEQSRIKNNRTRKKK